MDRVAAQTLRVVGIVAISIVIIVAALIFVIASMCGLWSSSGNGDEGLKLGLGIGCPVIFIGGIFLIAKLAKGMARSRREWKATVVEGVLGEAAVLQERDLVLEAEPLLHLRIALAARILLNVALLTYHQIQPGGYGVRRTLITAVVGFLIYEAPNGFILWRIREKLERFAVLLAVAYAGISLLWTMWNFSVYFRYMHGPNMLPTWLFPAAVEIAILITGWRARAAMPRRPDDDSTFAAAGAVAFVYTFLAYGITNLFYRMRPF
jgi:hypothetical protein